MYINACYFLYLTFEHIEKTPKEKCLLNVIMFQSSPWLVPQYWLLFSWQWKWQIKCFAFGLLKIFLNIPQVLRLICCQKADLAWAGTWQLLIRLETTRPNNLVALSLSFSDSLFHVDIDIEPANGELPFAFMQQLSYLAISHLVVIFTSTNKAWGSQILHSRKIHVYP